MKKFDQYVRHLRILSRAFDEDLTNDFIVSGIIDKYYIQFELGWKVLKELLRYEGANQAATGSPREIIKTAYAYYDIIHFLRREMLNFTAFPVFFVSNLLLVQRKKYYFNRATVSRNCSIVL